MFSIPMNYTRLQSLPASQLLSRPYKPKTQPSSQRTEVLTNTPHHCPYLQMYRRLLSYRSCGGSDNNTDSPLVPVNRDGVANRIRQSHPSRGCSQTRQARQTTASPSPRRRRPRRNCMAARNAIHKQEAACPAPPATDLRPSGPNLQQVKPNHGKCFPGM